MRKQISCFYLVLMLFSSINMHAITQRRAQYEGTGVAAGVAALSALFNKFFCDNEGAKGLQTWTPPSLPVAAAEVLLAAAAGYGAYCWRWYETPAGRETIAAREEEGIDISGILHVRSVKDARMRHLDAEDPLAAAQYQVAAHTHVLSEQQYKLQAAIEEADEGVKQRCVLRRDRVIEKMNYVRELGAIISAARVCEQVERAGLQGINTLSEAKEAHACADKPLMAARKAYINCLVDLDKSFQLLEHCQSWGVNLGLVHEWSQVKAAVVQTRTRLAHVKLTIENSTAYADEMAQHAADIERQIKTDEAKAAQEKARAALVTAQNEEFYARAAVIKAEAEKNQAIANRERAEADRITAPARAKAEADRAAAERATAEARWEKEEAHRLQKQAENNRSEAERLAQERLLLEVQNGAAVRPKVIPSAPPEDAPPAYSQIPSAPPVEEKK